VDHLTVNDVAARVDTLWVLVAGVLVFFMQAGFLLLEVGFSRMKNAGTVVAKVIANLSICAVCYWAVGFALAFGATQMPEAGQTAGWFSGNAGFFLHNLPTTPLPAMAFSDADSSAKFFFQFAFCAVSLAIVWGTTLERIKFGAYLIYAIVFSALIYPVISHWNFGGGWLHVNFGMQDFAG
jgi:Amt family ammonium transporter